MNQEPTYPCPRCQAGVLHLRYVTYYTHLGDDLLTVPNFPAWQCDVCGYLEYDPKALNFLHVLLSAPLQHEPVQRRGEASRSPRHPS